MFASNCHGRPSLAPRCACGELLILPQVYLDVMFEDPEAEAPESEPVKASPSDFLLAAE